MVPAFTVSALAAHLGKDLDTATATLALELATRYVRAYTRGRGFTVDVPADDLSAVILTVAARLYANPDGMRAETIGSVSYTSALAGFQGYTPAELAVLNGYRGRVA